MSFLSTVRARAHLTRLSPAADIYKHVVPLIDGGELDLRSRRGSPTLIVNTASKCGYTPQFAGLEALYERFRERGFLVLGCPSADFGGQELDDADEIAAFCRTNYDVQFPLMERSSVRFEPSRLWVDLAAQPNAGPPVWNFTKYLVGSSGQVVDWWSTNVRPESPRIVEAVEKALDA
jgi:glutathione peroxidase